MSISWFIAKRYLRTQRRTGFLSFITITAVLGVMLGTAALIIALSILDGFERDIKEKVIGFTSHIEVQGFQNKPLPNYKNSMLVVKREIRGVKRISPFAGREGMIRSKEAVDGIFLKGILPGSDIASSRNHLIKGEFIASSAKGFEQIVIGKKLANRLNVDIGDRLTVFALPREGEGGMQPRASQFQLSGIYESGMSEFDDIYAYTDLVSAQRLFQLGENVSGFDVLVDDIGNVDEIARKIQALLEYPHYSRTVFQLYRNLFSWVELQKKLSPVMLSLIIIVATVNIIGTLLMFVLEKTKAIGILKSLGAGPRLIQGIFRLQGLSIAAAGIISGNLLAYIICWIQLNFKILSLPPDIYYMSTVPVLLRWENFVFVTAVALLLCLLTTVIPSRAAAKLHPVRAMHFG